MSNQSIIYYTSWFAYFTILTIYGSGCRKQKYSLFTSIFKLIAEDYLIKFDYLNNLKI